MILTTTAELKKYISVATSFNFATLEPYITKAINSYTKKVVGNLHVFLDASTTGTNANIKNEAREHLCSAIANFAYYLFSPYASITMDSSGMANVQNDKQAPLQNWQLISIQRELLRSGHESMDLLLEILEKNPAVFTDWTTEFGTVNKDLLVHNSTDFQLCYNINNSRQTFLSLVPSLRQIEDKYIKTLFSAEVIIAMKSSTTGSLLELKNYCQKAIVCFTIAKVYDEGIFHLDASGIKLKFDVLPWEKVQAVDYGKQVDQMNHAIKKQIENGTQYILLAKDVITDNASDFESFTKIYKKDAPIKYEAHKTSGIVGLV